MVVVTTAAGYYLAQRGSCDWGRLGFTLLGTGLAAAGASALNQVAEREFDALMPRTANRPLPTGRVRPLEASLFGIGLAVKGILVLAIFVNLMTAALGILTLATYLFLYTPAKRRTTVCTIIGAVPGALPVMMGFTAINGAITTQALVLFAVLFVWQMPHFLSIAILYRDDYVKGGFQMLPAADPALVATTRQIMLYSLTLIPMTLLPVMLGTTGMMYLVPAVLLGALFCAFGMICARSKTRASARNLFLVSIAYVPALLASMLIGKI